MTNTVKLTTGLGIMAFVAFATALVRAKGLFSAETAAWVQAFGSIAAIAAAGWAAGVPLRAQERDRRRARAERLRAISDAAQELTTHRSPLVHALFAGDRVQYDRLRAQTSGHDLALAEAVLKIPVSEWPSVSLRAALARLLDATKELDDVLARTGSFNVARVNKNMTFPHAGQFIGQADAFQEIWNRDKAA